MTVLVGFGEGSPDSPRVVQKGEEEDTECNKNNCYGADKNDYTLHWSKLELKSLTSFFIASKISVFNSFRQWLIRARRFFSMIGLLL